MFKPRWRDVDQIYVYHLMLFWRYVVSNVWPRSQDVLRRPTLVLCDHNRPDQGQGSRRQYQPVRCHGHQRQHPFRSYLRSPHFVSARQILHLVWLYAKPITKIDLADARMLNHLIWGALHQHGAIMNDIGSIDDIECFADIVVGDQKADPMVF